MGVLKFFMPKKADWCLSGFRRLKLLFLPVVRRNTKDPRTAMITWIDVNSCTELINVGVGPGIRVRFRERLHKS